MGGKLSTERPLQEITGQYDRVARFYKVFEPLYLIFPVARRRAVAALGLKPGDSVLEIGAGTGRNFPYLIDAVGPSGGVIAVDASEGMLGEARKLVEQLGWSNVSLQQQDAARLDLDRNVDAVLFSLSYSAMPEPERALEGAWQRLEPGGRLAVMDAGLTQTRFRRLLDPIARLLIRLGPGNPYSRPWEELAEYGEVTIERFMWIYYVCTVTKAEASPAVP
ncbi:MAG TPA: methyltransferase domain-containing protein [Solirubrobacterales bacterium]|nr:methyltransferase domain-containing protein [Solirubrobacterales bacterium]